VLTLEYAGLVAVFLGYAVVSDARLAAALYVLDHVFFARAIALETYLQKIGDPGDMAPTAALSFTIDHIAAVVVPVGFGLLWLVSPGAGFVAGAGGAATSLVLARFVPEDPGPGRETPWRRRRSRGRPETRSPFSAAAGSATPHGRFTTRSPWPFPPSPTSPAPSCARS
jgi:hypothetical protein